jgi:hypothetical protein
MSLQEVSETQIPRKIKVFQNDSCAQLEEFIFEGPDT